MDINLSQGIFENLVTEDMFNQLTFVVQPIG